MTTTASSPLLEAGLSSLAFSRRLLDGLSQSFPQDRPTYQPFEGANHLAWVLGHISWTDHHFLTEVCGVEMDYPESWAALFGMKSLPVDDPDAYPSLAELHGALESIRAGLIDWFRSRTPEQLLEPLPEKYAGFAPNYATLMSTLAAHECLHAGQITALRRALGLEFVMG